MSEAAQILPRRRSFNLGRNPRQQGTDLDDRSTGERSTRSGGGDRRRRSRSPLRAASRSIVGKLAKIGTRKKSSSSSSKKSENNAAAAILGYDVEDDDGGYGDGVAVVGLANAPASTSLSSSSSSQQSRSAPSPVVAEPDVAGGKDVSSSSSSSSAAAAPKSRDVPDLLDDEETVYGVVLDSKQPTPLSSPARASSSFDSFDKTVEDAKKAVAESSSSSSSLTTAASVAPSASVPPVDVQKKAESTASALTATDTAVKEEVSSLAEMTSSRAAVAEAAAAKQAKEAKKKEASAAAAAAAAAAKQAKEAKKKDASSAAAPAAKSAVPKAQHANPPQTKERGTPGAAAEAPRPSTSSTSASVAVPPTVSLGPAIQIILLLMDPASRRFELLQLEFDSSRALVSDVLAQIPLSATVESMRTQPYRGVCDRRGIEMENGAKLSGFTEGRTEGEVILAIPHNMTARECSKLARPILSDPNVVAMLNPTGAAALATVREDATSSSSDLMGEKRPSENETSRVNSRSAPGANPSTAHDDAAAARETSSSAKSPSSSSSVLSTIVTVLVLAAAVVAGSIRLHRAMTTPLGPGDWLKPGARRSRCGFLGLVPESMLAELRLLAEKHMPPGVYEKLPEVGRCDMREGIEMGLDGVLRKYNGLGVGWVGGEVVWEIVGGVCPEESEEVDGAEECVPGLVVEEDGRLMIGGQPAKIGTIKEALEPWPFLVDPAKIVVSSKWW